MQIILSNYSKLLRAIYLPVFLLLVLGLKACNKGVSVPVVRVAVAANFAEPIRILKAEFEQEHSCKVDLIVASSGILCNQIRQGAPYQLFFSADRSYPELLYSEGFSLLPPEVYARGQLVLASNTLKKLDMSICSHLAIENLRIAIPKPDLAPYGKAAMQFLTSKDCWTSIKADLVYAQNVNQLNQYIRSGMIDLGFSSYSSTFLSGFKGVYIKINSEDYNLEQSCILLDSHMDTASLAKSFYNYMLSEEISSKLSNMGYLPPLH